jgi:hypothetical protein
VAGLSPRRPGYPHIPSHVGFVVDEVALGHVLGRMLRPSPASIILPALDVRSFIDSFISDAVRSQTVTPQLNNPLRNLLILPKKKGCVSSPEKTSK